MDFISPEAARSLASPQVAVHLVSQGRALEPLFLLSVTLLQALCKIFIRDTFPSDQPEHKGLLRSKTYVRILIFTLGFYSFIGSHLFIEHLLGMGSNFITDHSP